jgi:hypothetical protein
MTKTKLPADFPITPLGTSDGLYYFLSNGGSVRAFRPRELSRNEVAALAGSRLGYLLRKFPKPSAAKGKGTRNAYGFDVARVVDLLLVACEEAGTFDPESIRDVGPGPGPRASWSCTAVITCWSVAARSRSADEASMSTCAAKACRRSC